MMSKDLDIYEKAYETIKWRIENFSKCEVLYFTCSIGISGFEEVNFVEVHMANDSNLIVFKTETMTKTTTNTFNELRLKTNPVSNVLSKREVVNLFLDAVKKDDVHEATSLTFCLFLDCKENEHFLNSNDSLESLAVEYDMKV